MSSNIFLSFLIKISTSPIKHWLQRNETVIRILKQLNLLPEHPPADFSVVYTYTLVEYRVGKPKCLLEFFRQEDIKQAFRKAFENDNTSILQGELETFLDDYAFGDDIRALKLDVMREVADFLEIFIQVTKSTRTPQRVLSGTTIDRIEEKLNRLLEQNYRALPEENNKGFCEADRTSSRNAGLV